MKFLIWFLLLVILSIAIYFSKKHFLLSKTKTETKTTFLETKKETPTTIEKIGWITDMHASGDRILQQGKDNIVYPEKFKTYFPNFLDKMNREGIKIFISTGDNTQGEEIYAEKLKQITSEKKIKAIWVKGNHDREKTKIMETLGVPPPYYYFYDTNSIRIVVLNITEEEDFLNQDQLDWLKKTLEESPLPVLIATHSSLIDYEKNSLYSKAQSMEKIIAQSKKVQYVISGHYHHQARFTLNDVSYFTTSPLSAKSDLGNYCIIEIAREDQKIKCKNL